MSDKIGIKCQAGKEEAGEDTMAQLREEYSQLIKAMNSRSHRKDPAILMRLNVVMMDLGLYSPSSP